MTIFVIEKELETGLSKEEIMLLLSNYNNTENSFVPFNTPINNSCMYGFIPQSVLNLSEFDEKKLNELLTNIIEENPSNKTFTLQKDVDVCVLDI